MLIVRWSESRIAQRNKELTGLLRRAYAQLVVRCSRTTNASVWAGLLRMPSFLPPQQPFKRVFRFLRAIDETRLTRRAHKEMQGKQSVTCIE